MPAATPPDALGICASNPWFASLPALERSRLLAAARPLRCARGEMLFRYGDAVDMRSESQGGFYVLLHGVLKASTLNVEGREAIFVVLQPGNWFAELSVLDGTPRTHDVTAMEDSHLLNVPPTAFAGLMQRPTFARAITMLLAGRVRALYGLVQASTLHSTQGRIAYRLGRLAHGDATQAQASQRSVTVSQEALSMMLGITRQTLSRELHALADAGLLRLRYGRIDILQPEHPLFGEST